MQNENPNVYRSPDGFSIEVLGRTGLRYRENGRSYFVDAEVLAPPGGIAVYRGSVVQEKSSVESLPVSNQARKRILSNIHALLSARGLPVDFI